MDAICLIRCRKFLTVKMFAFGYETVGGATLLSQLIEDSCFIPIQLRYWQKLRLGQRLAICCLSYGE